jgi:hypothetical protein
VSVQFGAIVLPHTSDSVLRKYFKEQRSNSIKDGLVAAGYVGTKEQRTCYLFYNTPAQEQAALEILQVDLKKNKPELKPDAEVVQIIRTAIISKRAVMNLLGPITKERKRFRDFVGEYDLPIPDEPPPF